MAQFKFQEEIVVFDGKTTTGWGGKGIFIADFKNVIFGVFTSGNANCTILPYISLSDAEPTWSSAVSPSNRYAPIAIWELGTPTLIPGTTGVVASGTDLANYYMVNTDAQAWLNFNISAISAGAVTLVVKAFTNA